MISVDLPKGITARLVLPASEYARDRTPWLRERRNGIGASEISAILGLNKFVSPLDVWESKVDESEPTDDMPEAAFWGLKNEHNVATVFAMRHPELGKIYPTPGLLAHPENDILRATLDRLLVKRRVTPVEVTAGVECKTVGDWAYREFWVDGQPPTHIELQTQWQMGVTGLQEIHVPHLIGGNNLQSWHTTRDEDVIDSIFTFADNWWQTHIVGGVRPDPIPVDFDRMSEIFPARPPAVAKIASDEIVALVAKHLDAKRREKEAVEDKKAAAFEIQKWMGDAEEIKDRDAHTITTWKRPKQSYTVDADKLATEYPEIYQEVLKPKSNPRTFVTKEIAI